MQYKHVFFDLDHTLWDFETNAHATLQELYGHFELEQRGVTAFDIFHRTYMVHNERLWERFRKGYIKRDELRWKRMWITLLDFKIADEALARSMSTRFLEKLPLQSALFPGAVETLEYLQKKYVLHLITNGFEETQTYKMRNAGIADYFTHMITSETAGCLKPHRGIFDFALQKAGCCTNEAIMIGDALEVDIRGAREAGIDQVYFNPAVPPNGLQPTYTIGHLLELKEIL